MFYLFCMFYMHALYICMFCMYALCSINPGNDITPTVCAEKDATRPIYVRRGGEAEAQSKGGLCSAVPITASLRWIMMLCCEYEYYRYLLLSPSSQMIRIFST